MQLDSSSFIIKLDLHCNLTNTSDAGNSCYQVTYHVGNCFIPDTQSLLKEAEAVNLLHLRPTCAAINRVITRHCIPRQPVQRLNGCNTCKAIIHLMVCVWIFSCSTIVLLSWLWIAPITSVVLLLGNLNSVLSTHQRTGGAGDMSTAAL